MYYASNQWCAVGCMIAGFGVYTFVSPCVPAYDVDALDDTYRDKYKTIAMVVIAVMLKMLVAKIFAPKAFRYIAAYTMQEALDSCTSAYEAFLGCDIQRMISCPSP